MQRMHEQPQPWKATRERVDRVVRPVEVSVEDQRRGWSRVAALSEVGVRVRDPSAEGVSTGCHPLALSHSYATPYSRELHSADGDGNARSPKWRRMQC
jgi:hypothetical protein